MDDILDPRKKVIRKMGYLKDQKGILKRYFREEGNWHSHIDNCHKFILKELKLKKSDKVLVLGSGWLLDFPFDEVKKLDNQVALADIWHPRQIVKKAQEYPSIKLIDIDITGGLIAEVYSAVNNGRKVGKKPQLDDLRVPKISYANDFDLVISLNILNQLDILLIDYLNKFWDYSENEIIDFRNRVQKAHLEMFQDKRGILIFDTKEIFKDQLGQRTNEKKSIFAQLPVAKVKKSWTWTFDTHKLYHRDYRTDLYVEAISF